MDRLFTNFGKLDEHEKINPAGTGLGLSICKQIIEKMGGSVKVESIFGEGTIFSIDICTKGRRRQEDAYMSKLLEEQLSCFSRQRH